MVVWFCRQGDDILLLAQSSSDSQSHGDQQSIPEEKHAAPVRPVPEGFRKMADDIIVLTRIRVSRVFKNDLQDLV